MSKLIKNLIKHVAVPFFALGINARCRDTSQDFSKYLERGNLTMRVWNDGMGNHFVMEEFNENGESIACLGGVDNFPYTKKSMGDWKMDRINFDYQEGIDNTLSKYSIEDLNKLYKEVKETGENID